MVNLLKTKNDKWIILIRLLVGFVFVSEGIQKFLFPEVRGAGRFEDIGMPAAEFFGYFVGSFETVCGLFVLAGAYIRVAVIPLITIMISAIILTKIPILQNQGFWAVAHAARTDLSMLVCSLFMLVKGSGGFSSDLLSIQKRTK
jgi:putative oxidoreductase